MLCETRRWTCYIARPVPLEFVGLLGEPSLCLLFEVMENLKSLVCLIYLNKQVIAVETGERVTGD